mmetsp:Transcript_1003/g.2084  ORF Transcript_1003/g.2084 Transcript_1003/m.2084 type:complete len:351 (-) Transcript_1003:1324-2376(-)
MALSCWGGTIGAVRGAAAWPLLMLYGEPGLVGVLGSESTSASLSVSAATSPSLSAKSLSRGGRLASVLLRKSRILWKMLRYRLAHSAPGPGTSLIIPSLYRTSVVYRAWAAVAAGDADRAPSAAVPFAPASLTGDSMAGVSSGDWDPLGFRKASLEALGSRSSAPGRPGLSVRPMALGTGRCALALSASADVVGAETWRAQSPASWNGDRSLPGLAHLASMMQGSIMACSLGPVELRRWSRSGPSSANAGSWSLDLLGISIGLWRNGWLATSWACRSCISQYSLHPSFSFSAARANCSWTRPKRSALTFRHVLRCVSYGSSQASGVLTSSHPFVSRDMWFGVRMQITFSW